MKIAVDKYEFNFSLFDGKILPYEDDSFKGVKFNFMGIEYDVFINKQPSWPRILITCGKNSEFGYTVQDLPLNDGTIKLLPNCIKVEKII